MPVDSATLFDSNCFGMESRIDSNMTWEAWRDCEMKRALPYPAVRGAYRIAFAD